MVSFESKFVLQKYNRSEFAVIVLNVESIWFTLDNRMATTNTNIVDSDLTLMTSTQFEIRLLIDDCE
jgi:hypothetical protein